jgi:uncharacterized membrane protein YidH (DUF202 family)
MWADPGLAVERTALAWQRTGLTHMATGALLLRLLPATPLRPALATAMILIGAVASIGGRRLQAGEPHRRWLRLFAAATTAMALATAAASFS